MQRIKFYSTNDLTLGYNLEHIEKLLKKCSNRRKELNINDMIELYNARKYFNKGIYLKKWSAEDIDKYKSAIDSYFGITAGFFKSINEDNFEFLYSQTNRNYKDDFWELIDKFKAYENISVEKFKEFMINLEIRLHEILRHKKIVKYFGEEIREIMINSDSATKILLDKYEIKHLSKKSPLYLPAELTATDKKNIISSYIESPNPNLNYLRLITNIQSNEDRIKISPKMIKKAKEKVKEQEEKLFDDNSGIQTEIAVVFSENQDGAVDVNFENNGIHAEYSLQWIKDNLDYPTFLNNFIYLFDYVDSQMRSTLVSKFYQMSVFERFGFISSKNAYKTGFAFNQKDILSLMQLKGYHNELLSLGIRLEEIIEWFFEEYLFNEFKANKFQLNMPSFNSNISEKCTTIMPAMESALNQFSLFVEEGEIDLELLWIRSEQLIYGNIPSMVNKKYVYGVGDEYNKATSFLFSDQVSLTYSEKTEQTYKNYFELLCNEKIKLDDYPEYYTKKVNWLLEQEYLKEDKSGNIILNNKSLIMILRDLYFNEVISYWRLPKAEREIIDKLKQKNIVEFENTLFSRPEQEYINYLLNKSQFNNGLDLRNEYAHGQPNPNNEKKHKQNYFIFLRLFILVVIKINDDFQISEKI
ncbi:hypothetical protein [Halanaerobium congolense]|jgi:hypothetical protein|uniref:Uncharacterized protein n=1 Tax=Halanaerobium congolense TaxID=54121 RepID=A0A1G6QGI1_9FIRM|nr:hypothetical protein [Halanaerobium congolense]SDC91590.1 hypothetical protein SAMN04488597_11821 [Halanaerobium congolense]